MTAFTFALSDLMTGRLLALAVIAPEARYCSLLRVGANRIERRFVPLDGWRAIEQDLRPGLDAGLWPADSSVAQALGVSKAYALRFVSAQLVETPELGAAEAVDNFLRAQAAPTEQR